MTVFCLLSLDCDVKSSTKQELYWTKVFFIPVRDRMFSQERLSLLVTSIWNSATNFGIFLQCGCWLVGCWFFTTVSTPYKLRGKIPMSHKAPVPAVQIRDQFRLTETVNVPCFCKWKELNFDRPHSLFSSAHAIINLLFRSISLCIGTVVLLEMFSVIFITILLSRVETSYSPYFLLHLFFYLQEIGNVFLLLFI